jgi:multidrug efflux pump subunit AcrA (membrane-fusion protein)
MKRIALFLLALLTASCAREGTATAVSAASEPPRVAVARVTRANLSRDVALTAEFEPFQEIDVMAKVSGYIREIKVDIGDRVRQGQVLAVLEIPEMQDDLARAAASIEEARAELATARDDLQRAQSAHEAAHLSYARRDPRALSRRIRREPSSLHAPRFLLFPSHRCRPIRRVA